MGGITYEDQWTIVMYPLLQIRLVVDGYSRDVDRQAGKFLNPKSNELGEG